MEHCHILVMFMAILHRVLPVLQSDGVIRTGMLAREFSGLS